MSKEAYYFSHDSNARNDPKIQAMIGDYGAAGYGVYWFIVEMLREQDNFKLPLKNYVFSAIAMQVQCKDYAKDNAKKFVEDCINEYELFETDGQFFWSNSLIKRMDKKNDVSEKRRAAAKARWEKGSNSKDTADSKNKNDANAMQKNANAMQSDAIKGKESKVKESKEKENNIIAADNPFTFYENNFGVLSSFIAEDLGQWVDDLNPELVIRAMQKALEQNKRQWGYVKSILNDWAKNKFTTIEQVEAADLEFRNRNKKGEQQNGEHTKQDDEWSKAWEAKLERLKNAEPNF
jgi:DnaD/phage-associated family protein